MYKTSQYQFVAVAERVDAIKDEWEKSMSNYLKFTSPLFSYLRLFDNIISEVIENGGRS